MSAVAPSVSSAPARVIASRVLGEFALTTDQLVRFPEGLHGFPEETEFALVPAARDGFWWLQSTREAGLAFLLTDPFMASPGYEVDLSEGDQAWLGLTSPDDALVLAIVTLPATRGEPATVNLRGPIVCHARSRKARQLVSRNETQSFTAPLAL